MSVVTRFAPSPTGYLHIGGARTALFNKLFAQHHGGTFLLRVEDTDRERSTDDAVEKIFEGLRWMGLEWDGEPTMQFSRADRHVEIAQKLLAEDKAYLCTCTPEELKEMRETAKAEGRPMGYDGRCRRNGHKEGLPAVVRLKTPEEGQTVIKDLVQGDVTFSNTQLDDMVLLRSDGTPTYMLAVVVDDHDMGVTHVIRGDDHLNNAGRQALLYQALGWDEPAYAHIPLIHGADGAKLSKRHGALGVEAYRDMGYLPEAMRNYLLRLGWGHGDDEIISDEQAKDWFDTDGLGKSASRLDLKKLESLNAHYLKDAAPDRLVDLIAPLLEEKTGATLSEDTQAKLIAGMAGLTPRAKTILDLADGAMVYAKSRPIACEEKAAKHLDEDGLSVLTALLPRLEAAEWSHDGLEAVIKGYAEETEKKLGKVMQPMRSSLTGMAVTPSVFEVMEVLGQQETLARMRDTLESLG